MVPLSDIILKVNNINWNNNVNNYEYIDLSSVNIENKSIEKTVNITSKSAPSRAKQKIRENDILFGTTRPMLKRITIVPTKYDNQICSTGYCVLRPNMEKVFPEWIYYNLQTDKYYKYIDSYQQGASYPSISDVAVKNYYIPLPSLIEQRVIINTLNKFDKLINNINDGIPAEIELREKQYEYYRNKLLSFEELKNE